MVRALSRCSENWIRCSVELQIAFVLVLGRAEGFAAQVGRVVFSGYLLSDNDFFRDEIATMVESLGDAQD